MRLPEVAERLRELAIALACDHSPTAARVLLCNLELHRPTGLLLDHGRSFPNPPAGTHVVNFQPDEIAASQLAVDRQIEHGKIAPAFLYLEAHSNSPDILRLQRALLADEASLVPRLALQTRSGIFGAHGCFRMPTLATPAPKSLSTGGASPR